MAQRTATYKVMARCLAEAYTRQVKFYQVAEAPDIYLGLKLCFLGLSFLFYIKLIPHMCFCVTTLPIFGYLAYRLHLYRLQAMG